MTQFTVGSTALRLTTMPYDPVSFKRMRIDPLHNQFHVYEDVQGQVLFELRCDNTPVMAFLYQNLRPWELKQRKDAFTRLLKSEAENGLMCYSPLYSQTVETVPAYPMWAVGSPLGEDLFWANSGLLIDVIPKGTRCCCVEILSAERTGVANFVVSDMDSEEDTILDAVLNLRSVLRVTQRVRIEAIWEHQKVVWFVPSFGSK